MQEKPLRVDLEELEHLWTVTDAAYVAAEERWAATETLKLVLIRAETTRAPRFTDLFTNVKLGCSHRHLQRWAYPTLTNDEALLS